MAYDDEDEEPRPELSPEEREAASRARILAMREMRKSLLRWVYAGLAVLLIIVILLATLR
ncbi:MAG: hypothetical protein JHC71_15515 [Blastococcus sp.]|jgi:predicted anti-sigma-YlaC factor YlaD|nr:hypothetical protein [Blastococcus sp.]